jgi:hypothetical protein
MQSYIGVKIIEAEPEERDGKPGYKVAYPDGYTSWSPADVFRAAYLPLADPTRVTPAEVDAFLNQRGAIQISPKTTLVKATTLTGFEQYEVSSCVDAGNYDHEIGTKIATDRIKDRLWLCLGFVLQWGRFGLKQG